MKKSILKKIGVCAVLTAMMTGMLACDKKLDVTFNYDAGQYLELGQYKGIEVELDIDSIGDKLVESKIQSDAKANTTYTSVNREAKDTDRVNLDFYGSVEGTVRNEFSDEDYELVLGTDSFIIDGFIDELYGMKAGDTKIVTLQIPEDFSQDADYAGKRIVYEITMNKVEQGTVPMITDAYVKQAYGCETVAEYKEKVQQEINEGIASEVLDAKKKVVFKALLDNCEMKSYPEEELNTKKEEYEKSIKYYSLMRDMTVDQYCMQMFGVSFDDYVKNSIKQDAIMQLIIKQEDLSITESEYKKNLESFATQMGYSNKDSFVEKYGKDRIVFAMLIQKAENVVLDSAVYNKPAN